MDAFEAFMHHGVFDKMVFCLGKKQGMVYVVTNDCGSWYTCKSRPVFMLEWERRKEICTMRISACKVSQSDPTLECKANGNECYGSTLQIQATCMKKL